MGDLLSIRYHTAYNTERNTEYGETYVSIGDTGTEIFGGVRWWGSGLGICGGSRT